MTNISKLKSSSADYKQIYTELIKLIVRLDKQTAPYLIDELLTYTERIMLVKRFGAIFMFTQNYTPYRVSTTLGLSIPTTSRLYTQFASGHYTNLLGCISKKESNQFLQVINDLIAAQASPKARARIFKRVLN